MSLRSSEGVSWCPRDGQLSFQYTRNCHLWSHNAQGYSVVDNEVLGIKGGWKADIVRLDSTACSVNGLAVISRVPVATLGCSISMYFSFRSLLISHHDSA